jgi:hypothetical protein
VVSRRERRGDDRPQWCQTRGGFPCAPEVAGDDGVGGCHGLDEWTRRCVEWVESGRVVVVLPPPESVGIQPAAPVDVCGSALTDEQDTGELEGVEG